jgi:hypothetical protein
MSWFDDEKKPEAGSRAWWQDADTSEAGPGEPPNSPSWRWAAQNKYYSGGEMYNPEYDIMFYPVHIGGNHDKFARAQTVAGKNVEPNIRFRCWLTKFDDSFTSEWSSEHVYGRMDPIETFKGTRRVINLGFDIMASTTREAFANQRMVAALIRGLYPTYKVEPVKAGSWSSSVGIIQSPPVWKLKLANLIQDSSRSPADSARSQGLTGRIAGITYTPNLDEGVFTGHLLEEYGKIYPQSVSMDITFHVWHTHELGYTISHSPRSGFSNFPYAKSKSYTSSGTAEGVTGAGAPSDSDTDGNEAGTDSSGDNAMTAGSGGEVAGQEAAGEVAAAVGASEEASASSPTKTVGTGVCFVAGTMITIPGPNDTMASVEIEDIKVGDLVMSYNLETEKIEAKEVVELMQPLHKDIVEFVFSNGATTQHTYDHPYYVAGKGWSSYKPDLTTARYNTADLESTSLIEVGDKCIADTGDIVTLTGINEIATGDIPTYNFTVSDNRNYFADGILVHNKML